MGRIKSLMVKKAAKQLLAALESETFTTEFNHNKRVLGSTMPSKSVRNKIAGYLARVVKMRKVEKEMASSIPTPSVSIERAPQA